MQNLETQLYRVISSKGGSPVPITSDMVGSTPCLSFTVVPYWTKEKEAKVYYKAQIWGEKDVDKWEGAIAHGNTLLLNGSLEITPNKNSTDEVKLMPWFNIRVNSFGLKKVEVQKLEPTEATAATEDVIAARIAATTEADSDVVPGVEDF